MPKNEPKERRNKDDKPLKVEVSREREVLLSWVAPARPFKKRNREYYTTAASMVFLVAVILFLIKEWMLIGVVLSILFVVYVLSTVPPEDIIYTLTNKGVEIGDRHYLWEQMIEFSFEEKWGQKMVNIILGLPYHTRLHLLLGSQKEDEVKKILSEYIPFQPEPYKSWLDHASEWLTKKFPLETA